MKKLLILTLFTALYHVSVAQGSVKGFRGGIGATAVIPGSGLGNYSIGAGIDLLGHYGISDKLAITGDVGYTALFPNKENEFRNFSIIPIRAGLRFYPSSNFYLGAKGGAGIMSFEGSDGSQTNFIYSLGAGYKLNNKIDIGASFDGSSLKYTGSSAKYSFIGVRLGYFFN